MQHAYDDTAATTANLNLDNAPTYVRPAVGAQLVGVSTRTMRDWIARGLVRASRIGGRLTLVETASIRELIERHAVRVAGAEQK